MILTDEHFDKHIQVWFINNSGYLVGYLKKFSVDFVKIIPDFYPESAIIIKPEEIEKIIPLV
jgi:hypothetical protein